MARQHGVIDYNPDSYDADPQDAVSGTTYQTVHSFRAGEDLEQYELVMIDVSDTTDFEGRTVVATTATNLGDNAQLVVGVTLEEGNDGDTVRVCTGGFTLCQAAAGITAGQALTTDNGTDGQVEDSVGGTDQIIGVAVTATDTPETGHVWMLLNPRV